MDSASMHRFMEDSGRIGRADVGDLLFEALDGGEVTEAERTDLASLREAFADRFTASGRRAWDRLIAGLSEAGSDEVTYARLKEFLEARSRWGIGAAEAKEAIELLTKDGRLSAAEVAALERVTPEIEASLTRAGRETWHGLLAKVQAAASTAAPAGGRQPLSPDANPEWKSEVLRYADSFPELTDTNFEAIGPSDWSYNCIAWSLGITDEWVWPGDTVEDFDRLYAEHGYSPIEGLDLGRRPGFEKVALYGFRRTDDDGETTLEPTHAARMDASGYWMSKLGALPLIRRDGADDVCGPAYGDIIRVYVRPVES